MQNKPTKYSAIILLLIIIAFFAYNKSSHKNEKTSKAVEASVAATEKDNAHLNSTKIETSNSKQSIEELTKESVVVAYVKEHGELPACYITKREVRKLGWNPSEGNLCDVLPGRAIGGDAFSNREGRLPEASGRVWHEADLNYNCDNRNSDRLLFSNDGLVYVTHNHYKTFEEQ